MTTEPQILKLEQIRIDGGTQPRVTINQDTVSEYAEDYGRGEKIPPVTVFFDGVAYWLADGFHRYWATKKINSDYIMAEIHKGTQRDAILFSVGANAGHGLRRTNPDKRKAVLTLLKDEEWSQWSDREIAKRCGVSDKTVAAARKNHTSEIPKYESTERNFTHAKTGKPAKMKTGKIGTKKAKRKPGGISPDAVMPVLKPIPALAQTHINLPHDPIHGARAIVSAMGADYAEKLIDCLTAYLQQQKEGVA